MTAVLPPRTTSVRVEQPGVYELSEADYHGDPVDGGSLSSSGAKLLLPPSCPAKFKYQIEHPPTPKPAFDLGSAAHKLVLGVGADIVPVDAPDWRTKAAREQRDTAHEAGQIPVLRHDYNTVQAMAAALRVHPWASALFNPERGMAEQSLFWIDQQAGIWRRSRLDWLPDRNDGRILVSDYKTAVSADLGAIQRTVYSYRYFSQAAWYLDAVVGTGYHDNASFLFVVQEKEPPFVVTVVQLDADAIRKGRILNRRAIDLYAQCKADDHWPGYSETIETISLPAWANAQLDIEEM